jgi:hypothetical protein
MNDSITFNSNTYLEHDKFIELSNSLSNEEKCLLITTLTSSMTDSVDVLLTDKHENIQAVFGCKSTWLTASLNGLQPVFSFEYDYVSMIAKGKKSIDKDVLKHVQERDDKHPKGEE